jgi:hypothetical protein
LRVLLLCDGLVLASLRSQDQINSLVAGVIAV